MSFQIVWMLRLFADLEIHWRANNDQTLIRAKWHRDHVPGQMLGQPYAGVEAISHNIDKAIVRDNVHGHFRIPAHKLKDDRRKNLPRTAGRNIEAQNAKWRSPVLIDTFNAIPNGRERGL